MPRFLATAALLLFFFAPEIRAQTPSGHGLPLERAVDALGRLDLPPGFQGTLDPKGWRMEMASDGAPRFARASTTKGDENWEGEFTGGFLSPGDVLAIAVSGTDVYVGGIFVQAGNTPASYIAKWNGTEWKALGSGVNGRVDAIAVSGSDVYAGGVFTKAGDVEANNIAKWNGSEWEALGSGVDGFVGHITLNGDDVYAGGSFTQAGGKPSYGIAQWDAAGTVAVAPEDAPPAGLALTTSPNPFRTSAQVAYTLAEPGRVRIAVYDLLGREVAVLVDGIELAGAHTVTFDAAGLASGTYLCRLEAGGRRITRLMVLVR